MTARSNEDRPIKLTWQATEVLRVLKAVGACPGRPVERDTLLRHNLGGLTLNQGVEALEAANFVATHPNAVEITTHGHTLIG